MNKENLHGKITEDTYLESPIKAMIGFKKKLYTLQLFISVNLQLHSHLKIDNEGTDLCRSDKLNHSLTDVWT